MYHHKIIKVESLRCEVCKSTAVFETNGGTFCEDCNKITVKGKHFHYEGGVLPDKIVNAISLFLED